MSASPSPPSKRTRAYVRWVLRHGRWLWLAALLLAVFTFWRTARLYIGLRSELELLLPQSAPSVAALQELRARMPGIQFLGVVIDAGTAENLPAAERFADDLAERIRAYPPDQVAAVRTGISEERAFLEDHAPLYANLDDLVEVRKRIEARRDWEATRAMGADLDDEPAPALDFSDIEKRYKEKAPTGNRFPNGRFSSEKEHATVLLVEIRGYSTGSEQARKLLDRIRADARDLGFPANYAPGMQYAFTGDPAIRVEELSALVTDLTFSSVVIIALVILTLVVYFRWWRAVPAIIVPLLLSTSYSFTLAGVPPFRVLELNSNTAFLGSIIVGNGINFAIILVARYLEERRNGADVGEALAWAVHSTRVGTVTAAAAAGIAYGSLMVTQFRGFWQFGVIGGMGMLVCWATTFLLVPPLLAWLDSKPSAAPRPIHHRHFSFTGWVARIVSAKPGLVVIVGSIVTIAAIIGSRGFGRDRLETDYSKMRRRDTWQTGEGYWGRRMDAVLGRYLTPLVVMTDSPGQARAMAATLREAKDRPPLSEIIASISDVDTVLPQQQAEKIREAQAIRKTLTPKIRAEIPQDKRALVDRMLGDDRLRPVRPEDLPASFVTAMREHDGTIDKAVLLYPKLAKETWQGMKLVQMAAELRSIAARFPGPDGRVPRIAGQTLISADITTSMLRDGPLATLVAIGGVIALIVGAFRFRRETLLVFASLIVGVLWMVWGTMLFDIRLNFANFIGFPITFGIGVDYAVNVMSRYRLDGGRDVIGAIRSTGGAVGMCSLTTIIGYSSLLMAKSQALFSFGVVAVLGEITCLATAVLLLPAILLLLDRRAARSRTTG